MNPQLSQLLIELAIFAVFLVIAIFFILTQEHTLKAIDPRNRVMRPSLVWLQLIPVFNFIWQIVVVIQIARSASKQQLDFLNDDSVLGLPPNIADRIGKSPTLLTGLTYSVLYVLTTLLQFTNLPTYTPLTVLFLVFVMLASWIIYWIQLAQLKRKILRAA